MNPFRILHISDTHLSRDKPWFAPNFEAVVAIASVRRPDLVVNTGDISLDGAGLEDDLAGTATPPSTFRSAPCPAITTSVTIPGERTSTSRTEVEQWALLASVPARAAGRPVALFGRG